MKIFSLKVLGFSGLLTVGTLIQDESVKNFFGNK
jgi:hypothetical protein